MNARRFPELANIFQGQSKLFQLMPILTFSFSLEQGSG